MRSLYFHAHVGAFRPGPILGMISQVEKTLQPFDRFLVQAIRTAESRQTRYALPWEKAYATRQVKPTPADSRVLVPRRPAGWLIADWPPDLEPELSRPLTAINRDLSFIVLDFHRDQAGLHVIVDGELSEDDVIWWCGRPCPVTRETVPPPPALVTTADGVPLRMTQPPEQDEGGWVLVLEGRSVPGTVIVDGDEVPAQRLPAMQGLRRLRDSEGSVFELRDGQLVVEDLPAKGLLAGDNGVRFSWAPTHGRTGKWVQLLLPPDGHGYDFLDPRAAFCDGELGEVWSQPRRRADSIFKIMGRDPDQYQLKFEDWPPAGQPLYLPMDVNSLQLQRRAVYQLINTPLPHHRGLLRLCEDPATAFWPGVEEKWPPRWTELVDQTRSGTDEQRAFVAKALGSPDLMMLEGPPGSGKTTAICELIRQLVADGKRVLLCASTHVAIDNVLERLIADTSIYPVRIGDAERVDENVQDVQLDRLVEHLVRAWQGTPGLQELGDGELKEMATRVVVAAANLTCGTTMGIMRHPLLSRGGRNPNRPSPITKMPHWDVLVVDEASKTLIQEFLVPAMMARRWVIVGDIQQLPPFNDRDDIEANLRSLADSQGREMFPPDHQRACLIRYWLATHVRRRTGARWLVVEPPGVLDRLGQEILRRDDPVPSAVRVVSRTGIRPGPFREVSVSQLRDGDPAALALAACDWVLVAADLLAEVAGYLPADLLYQADPTSGEHGIAATHPLLFQHQWWLGKNGKLNRPYGERRRDDVTTFAQAENNEQKWLAGHDLASEIAWRLIRRHELKHSSGQGQLKALKRTLDELLPVSVDISDPIAQIQEIGFPSILEVLQEGIGTEPTGRKSALTEGLGRQRADVFRARFVSLSYQHRMHPDISAFPRALIYDNASLLDANTIEARDRTINWTFGPFPGRRAWIDVDGLEERRKNAREVNAMGDIVAAFLQWAEEAGPPPRKSLPLWEVACLTFYTKQAAAIAEKLAEVTGDKRRNRFRAGNVEIVCGTVDRFQGREADLVLLSMCNSRRVGFLDSRNRLNVAITRARQQLLIFGKASFFRNCDVSILQELARRTPVPKRGG